jgi:uncharacterized membrane protein (UPF0127 family)
MSYRIQVQNLSKNTMLGHRITVAESERERRDGLLSRECLDEGEGLLIYECDTAGWAAIHTIGMKFLIDVLFLDKLDVVVQIVPALRPGHRAQWLATSVLELPTGRAAECATEPGDVLYFARSLIDARNLL